MDVLNNFGRDNFDGRNNFETVFKYTHQYSLCTSNFNFTTFF